MGLFTIKHSLVKSGILHGKTDIHSHLLPGVDDGSPDIAHTQNLLAFMTELGYQELWFTPHVMHGMGNTAERLQQRFNEFLPQYTGNLKIHLSSEYMMDEGFEERLTTDPLPLGKDHLLVETSYMSSPTNLEDILLSVWNRRFKPLIAHPERYMYMEEDDYWYLHDKGYEFQLNLMSLSGYYGGRAKYVAEQLLMQNFYDYVGSDLHHIERYKSMLMRLKLTTKQLDKLEQLLVNNTTI
jgi:tyrosine-protein phosphatase YwqE